MQTPDIGQEGWYLGSVEISANPGRQKEYKIWKNSERPFGVIETGVYIEA